MHVFKVHFKYRVFINCVALQSACCPLLITENGSASYFAWPRSSLSVSLPFEHSFFLGQLPLFSSCNLMIGGIFQTLLSGSSRGAYQCGAGTERALLLHDNMQKQPPGDGRLPKALGMDVEAGAPGSGGFCQRMVL